MKRRQCTRSPVYLEAPSSFHAGREILSPASPDKLGDVGAHDKLVGVARLHARVNDEGRAVRDVLTAHVGLGGVDVCGWLEARPRRPQEINRRARDRRVVVEDDEGPVLEDFFTREARCLLWVFREGGTLNDEAAGAEDFGARDGRGERVESGLAVSPEVAHARHDEWEERREKFLQVVADEEVFLPRLSDDGRGIDRVLAMKDRIDVEDRVVVSE